MLATDHRSSRFRLGLRLQLIIAMGVLAALLATVAGTALLSLRNVREDTSRTVEIEGELNRLASQVVIYTQLCRLYEKDFFLNIGNPMLRDSYLMEWRNASRRLDAAITAFGLAATTDGDREQVRQWRMQLDNYRKAFAGVQESIDVGYILTIESAFKSFSLYKQDIQSLTNTAQTRAEMKARRAQRAEATLLETTASSIQLLLVISVLALIVAVAWCLLFPIHLMRPIAALQAATNRLAAGDLGTRVQLRRSDELGLLGRRFDEMAATLQQRTSAIEAQHERANAARLEAESARAEIAEQLAMIEEQRSVIREMSVPVLPLSHSALVLPLVGALDSERLMLVQEQALRSIEERSARYLILDITGVPIVDTAVAQGLIKVVQTARLLGAEVVLVGIRPEVAQAVVGLGIQLSDIVTRSTLQSGIGYVLGRTEGMQVMRARAS
ncbi:MAG TPA: STAS domain-containing protein [Roseiflexaceae bacterium]|nr:STAS domain-containing protein [Roseiflexaceae bacterium]